MEKYAEICGDNRFELIAKYKAKLIEGTNIEMAKEEMDVIDNILFRFWQMGWLDKLEADVVPRSEVEKIFDEYGNYNFPTEAKENYNNTVVTGGYVIDWYKEAGLNAKRIMELEAELTKAKQDVAKQIFEEFETSLVIGGFVNGEKYLAIREDDYNHYKKKYIGE